MPPVHGMKSRINYNMIKSLKHLHLTFYSIVAADILAILSACIIAIVLRAISGGNLPLAEYLRLLPTILLFVVLYASFGLYPGLSIPAPEKLKRLSISSSMGFLFISVMLFMGQRGEIYSRFIFLSAWLFTLVLVPLFRYLGAHICCKSPWWGYTVILVGRYKNVAVMADYLRHRPWHGFKAVTLVITDDNIPENAATQPSLVQIDLHSSTSLKKKLKHERKNNPDAIIALLAEGIKPEDMQTLFKAVNRGFRRILLIPETMFYVRLSVQIAEFSTKLAFSLRQNLLDPYRMLTKRLLDISIIIIFSVPTAIVMLTIYVVVRLDTRGPAFYKQKRIGREGREFFAWKFRTMVTDADAVLAKYLEDNPQLADEWSKDHKLKHDPRITKTGALLRKFSLDELPQLFNVIVGEMSLVGPRPIVEQEVKKYGDAFDLYTRVRPGITGLWQTSGRNDVTYAMRVSMDRYYIANWSVWLDIFILIKTAPAALTAKGAY